MSREKIKEVQELENLSDLRKKNHYQYGASVLAGRIGQHGGGESGSKQTNLNSYDSVTLSFSSPFFLPSPVDVDDGSDVLPENGPGDDDPAGGTILRLHLEVEDVLVQLGV